MMLLKILNKLWRFIQNKSKWIIVSLLSLIYFLFKAYRRAVNKIKIHKKERDAGYTLLKNKHRRHKQMKNQSYKKLLKIFNKDKK